MRSIVTYNPELHRPANMDDIVIAVHTDPDGLNRQQFTTYWRDGYLPPDGVRAQVFYMPVDEHVKYWKSKGKRVAIVEDRS